MADNVLSIVLRFLVDKKSQEDVNKAIDQIGQQTSGAGATALKPSADYLQSWQEVNNYAQSFNVSVDEATRLMEGMSLAGGKTAAQLRADYDEAERLGAGMQQAAQSAGDMAENVKTISLITAGRALSRLGNEMSRFSQLALTNPINAYTGYAGMASGASAEWLQTQKDLENSTVRIGAVFTRELLPVMQQIAKLAGQVADLMEANPPLAKAAVALLAGGLVVGQILRIAGDIVLAAFALQKLGGTTLAAGAGAALKTGASAAAGAVGGAVTGAAKWLTTTAGGAALAGGVIGVSAYDALAQARGWQSAGQIAGKTFTTLAYEAGRLFGPETAAQWGASIGHLTGAIQDMGDAADKNANKVEPGQAEVDAYIQYRQQEVQAEKDYAEQRQQVVEDYGKQRVDAEKQYEADRANLIADYLSQTQDDQVQRARDATRTARDYSQQEAQYEKDYYKNRQKLAEQYNTDVQRAEEDHQRQMLELQRKHDERIADLADQRDALGIWREQRSYEADRKDAEAQYALESSRRSEDFTKRMQEMEAEFADQRSRRLQDQAQRRADDQADYQYQQAQRKAQFEQKLKELDAAHKVEMQTLDKEQMDKLNQLQVQYNKERIQRNTAFSDQLRDLNAALLGETTLRQQYYIKMQQDLETWLKSMGGSFGSNLPDYPKKAAGGYTTGFVHTGEQGYEWILDHNTTRIAEKLAGGNLTQQTIIKLMTGVAGGQGSVTINDQRHFDSRLSAADRREINRDTAWLVAGALNG